ncbi:MAG: hypothetical protein K2N38_04235 [Oscillospiraceae bacterium]|nr:hypothetical protein [Oscillospiraceae bacterium]
MRAKTSKIIYAVSFIPLMLCIVIGIVSAGMGGSFLTDFCFIVIIFTAIPVLPVCLIIQIVCLLMINKKEHGIPLKKYLLITVAATVGICGGSALIFFGDTLMLDIEKYFEKRSAIHMIKNAEEKITYNESTYYFGGVFGIDELLHNTMLIDYDKNEIGFVFGSSTTGEFWKVKLEPADNDSYKLRSICEKYFIQADVPLSAPGKRLITFCEDKTTSHRTIAMIMETENGLLFADDIREKDTGYVKFNGFNGTYYVGEGVRYADLCGLEEF